ncbi:MAG: hypothetical protein HQ594_00825 [Candidatus Omnitrophica bacterium]|nr:hypothetical protein [Candidatus Omnitrophota bacterium]
MSRSIAARILRDEIKKIKELSNSLMDESKIEYPNVYDCSGEIKSIIHRLQKVRKGVRRKNIF